MKKRLTANRTFAIGGVSCSEFSFVVTEISVLRMNICVEKPLIADLQIVSDNPMTALRILNFATLNNRNDSNKNTTD